MRAPTAAGRRSGSPSNQTSPASGVIVPPSRLNTVVLPEPFGPISAVIEPSWTENDAPSTARSPPKRFSSPFDLEQRPPAQRRAREIGCPLLQLQPRADQAGRAALAPRLDEVPQRRDDAARQEQHDQHHQAAEDDRRELPPPSELLAYSLSGSMMNAPSTGPKSVPRPPSSIDSRIWTLTAGC